jgi:hypothetical protein
MQQLLPQRWLCSNVTGIRSKNCAHEGLSYSGRSRVQQSLDQPLNVGIKCTKLNEFRLSIWQLLQIVRKQVSSRASRST